MMEVLLLQVLPVVVLVILFLSMSGLDAVLDAVKAFIRQVIDL